MMIWKQDHFLTRSYLKLLPILAKTRIYDTYWYA